MSSPFVAARRRPRLGTEPDMKREVARDRQRSSQPAIPSSRRHAHRPHSWVEHTGKRVLLEMPLSHRAKLSNSQQTRGCIITAKASTSIAGCTEIVTHARINKAQECLACVIEKFEAATAYGRKKEEEEGRGRWVVLNESYGRL